MTATCPTCHAPVASLLASCRKRACLKADLDAATTQDLNIESSES